MTYETNTRPGGNDSGCGCGTLIIIILLLMIASKIGAC